MVDDDGDPAVLRVAVRGAGPCCIRRLGGDDCQSVCGTRSKQAVSHPSLVEDECLLTNLVYNCMSGWSDSKRSC